MAGCGIGIWAKKIGGRRKTGHLALKIGQFGGFPEMLLFFQNEPKSAAKRV
jgi:hypothetical protein